MLPARARGGVEELRPLGQALSTVLRGPAVIAASPQGKLLAARARRRLRILRLSLFAAGTEAVAAGTDDAR